jgi:hypothetical protein
MLVEMVKLLLEMEIYQEVMVVPIPVEVEVEVLGVLVQVVPVDPEL